MSSLYYSAASVATAGADTPADTSNAAPKATSSPTSGAPSTARSAQSAPAVEQVPVVAGSPSAGKHSTRVYTAFHDIADDQSRPSTGPATTALSSSSQFGGHGIAGSDAAVLPPHTSSSPSLTAGGATIASPLFLGQPGKQHVPQFRRVLSSSGWSSGGSETSMAPVTAASSASAGRSGWKGSWLSMFSSIVPGGGAVYYEGLRNSGPADADDLEDPGDSAALFGGKRAHASASAPCANRSHKALSTRVSVWKFMSFLFLVSSVALAIAFVITTNNGDAAGANNGLANGDGADRDSNVTMCVLEGAACSAFSPALLAAAAPLYSASSPHPLDDLYPEELEAVRDALLRNRTLQLTPFGTAKVRDNFIYAVELLPPTKASVLAFLDNGAPKPPRYARVIIYHGAWDAPVVNEYQVGPLPIRADSDATVQLWRGPIPWSMRPVAANEYVAWEPIIRATMKALDQLTQESYNTVFDDGHMFYTDNAPRGYTRNTRQSWIWMMFAVEGEYINCLGLEMQIIHYDLDPAKWYITNFVYNNQGPFATVDELMWQYNNNATFQKIKLPYPKLAEDDVLPLSPKAHTPSVQLRQEPGSGVPHDKPVWSSLFNRGNARPFSQIKSPRTYYPEGQRFTIDGNMVDYLGWHIQVTSSIRSGLNLRDIRFSDERVIYELAIQDAYAGYAGRQPSQATSNYFDSGWGMGWNSYELVSGVDCPETSAFMDMNVLVNSGHVMTLKNSICLFEVDASGPMFRHYSKPKLSTKYSSAGGVRASHLIMRTAVTVYNYDYIYDYIFHLDGTIEVRMSATGYLQGGYYEDTTDNVYGQQVHSDTMGNLHDHIIGYKIDFDIAGMENSFQKMLFKVGHFPNNAYLPPSKTMKYIDRVTVPSEMHSTCISNTSAPAYWNIVNLNQTNSWGVPRGYRIVPMATIVNIMPDQVEFMPAASWTKYNLAVTVRHEEEERSTESLYDMQAPDDPLVSFDSFLRNDESIVQQDLVAWVAVGMMHQPHAEDVPVTLTVGSMTGFVLKPHNYFNINPGTDLNQGRIVRAPGNADGSVLPKAPLAVQLEHPPKSEEAVVVHDTITIVEKCYPRTLPLLYGGVPEYIHA